MQGLRESLLKNLEDEALSPSASSSTDTRERDANRQWVEIDRSQLPQPHWLPSFVDASREGFSLPCHGRDPATPRRLANVFNVIVECARRSPARSWLPLSHPLG